MHKPRPELGTRLPDIRVDPPGPRSREMAARLAQVENVFPSDPVSGAVHTLAAHPDDANRLFLGATNGGIWRTDDALSSTPTWIPLTDHLPSLSVGALELEPGRPDTLFAGGRLVPIAVQIGDDFGGSTAPF